MSISAFIAALLVAALSAGAGDTDGDGISDKHEAVLGTDLGHAERFRRVVAVANRNSNRMWLHSLTQPRETRGWMSRRRISRISLVSSFRLRGAETTIE